MQISKLNERYEVDDDVVFVLTAVVVLVDVFVGLASGPVTVVDPTFVISDCDAEHGTSFLHWANIVYVPLAVELNLICPVVAVAEVLI